MAYSICRASLELCEMLPDIQTVEKYDFLKSIIHSQIMLFSV